jgi:D-3-phosphoglycerate dehydrogenase
MTVTRILVSEPVSDVGLAMLKAAAGVEVEYRPKITREELEELVGGFDVLVVRSATKVDAALIARGARLKLIGRAGVGVDNVDVKAATRAGIPVMNTPGGNRFAVAELAVGLMLACVRPIVAACNSVKAGQWEKSKFAGRELRGKTIGVLGLGKIGLEVARRLKAFDVTLLGHDPFVPADSPALKDLLRWVPLDELLGKADLVTLHAPLTTETRGLLSADRIAKMKKGAIVVNTARGELVDEDALAAALDADLLSTVAVDVYASEPPKTRRLADHPKAITTPHIGASTREASEEVMTQLAQQVVDYVTRGTLVNAVNAPAGDLATIARLGGYLDLARKVGAILARIGRGPMQALEVEVQGDLDQPALFRLNLLMGFMTPLLGGGVNLVNAPLLAAERGIETAATLAERKGPIRNRLTVRARTAEEVWTIDGTLNLRGEPVITEINGFGFEIVPDGVLVFIRNQDVPGVIGQLGTFLGQAGVNIAEMRLARREDDPLAFCILKLDQPLTPEQFGQFKNLANLADVRSADLITL